MFRSWFALFDLVPQRSVCIQDLASFVRVSAAFIASWTPFATASLDSAASLASLVILGHLFMLLRSLCRLGNAGAPRTRPERLPACRSVGLPSPQHRCREETGMWVLPGPIGCCHRCSKHAIH